ncbi:Pyrimidine-specific ribonucleoside hydrolase RihA [Morella rubra]|uniref:Pyrimidine-specific ribonucleoside hydrolase RihA n=1 Tax=Morella rubra TaxID=262757 RepID=A0A6A1VML4_9ROSI|nr:Pyrimidine-specific ribonucleoside hydrolase RihA [Morella rubra]
MTQFPYYEQALYRPDFGSKTLGEPVVFNMDMSAGDFLALFYLLKVPVEVINFKAIHLSPTGWANTATIDVIYDLLHMMGRDDIPVGLGDVFGMNQYTAENSVKYGASRDTEHPELRQPLALEVWESVVETLDPGSKMTILTNGPLTNLARIVTSEKNATSAIQEVYIVGGHISHSDMDKGNVFSVPYIEFAEFNLDRVAAKTVFDSELDITLIPLGIQRRLGSFPRILERFQETKTTPEAKFAHRLLSRLYRLQQRHLRYQHTDIFLGEILGAVALAGYHSSLKQTLRVEPINVFAEGVEFKDGQTVTDEYHGKLVKILENVDPTAYYDLYVNEQEIQSSRL